MGKAGEAMAPAAAAKSQLLFEMPASNVNVLCEKEVTLLISRVNATAFEPTGEARNIPKEGTPAREDAAPTAAEGR